MKKLLGLVLWAFLLPTIALAQGAAKQGCYTTNGTNCVPAIQASASIPINIAAATTTQLVALSGTTNIFVTSWDVISGGTGNFTLVYGTGTNCGTGTTSLTGPYPLTAQAGISKGDGQGIVLIVPRGNALCATTSTSVQMSGAVSYAQFQSINYFSFFDYLHSRFCWISTTFKSW